MSSFSIDSNKYNNTKFYNDEFLREDNKFLGGYTWQIFPHISVFSIIPILHNMCLFSSSFQYHLHSKHLSHFHSYFTFSLYNEETNTQTHIHTHTHTHTHTELHTCVPRRKQRMQNDALQSFMRRHRTSQKDACTREPCVLVIC